MSVKKFIIGILGLSCLIGTSFVYFTKYNKNTIQQEKVEAKVIILKQDAKPLDKVVKKNYDLYSSTPYEIPLYSILEISNLSPVVKKAVDELLEASQGFYLLKKDEDKVLVILQNPVRSNDTFSRHDLQFAEIDNEGQIKYHTAGYGGKSGETSAEFSEVQGRHRKRSSGSKGAWRSLHYRYGASRITPY